MRFDENMNIVHDGRKETTQNIFSEEGENQNYYNYDTSDDNTMTGAMEPAKLK